MTSEEDELTGKQPRRKTTSQGDNLKGKKMNLQEESLTERGSHMKTTALQEDNFAGRQHFRKTTTQGNNFEER